MKNFDPNLNQGKRPDQIEGSYKAAAIAVVGVVVILVVLFLLKSVNLLPQ